MPVKEYNSELLDQPFESGSPFTRGSFDEDFCEVQVSGVDAGRKRGCSGTRLPPVDDLGFSGCCAGRNADWIPRHRL